MRVCGSGLIISLVAAGAVGKIEDANRFGSRFTVQHKHMTVTTCFEKHGHSQIHFIHIYLSHQSYSVRYLLVEWKKVRCLISIYHLIHAEDHDSQSHYAHSSSPMHHSYLSLQTHQLTLPSPHHHHHQYNRSHVRNAKTATPART